LPGLYIFFHAKPPRKKNQKFSRGGTEARRTGEFKKIECVKSRRNPEGQPFKKIKELISAFSVPP
jgi:hypothetical protein